MRTRLPIAAVLTIVAFASTLLRPDLVHAAPATAAPATTAPPDADLASAKQHFEAGRSAFNSADYPKAIREFKAAETLRPSPVLSYNIGLANEKLGRKRVAVRYFKRYLEGAPAAANRAEVEGRISALEQEIAAQPQNQQPEQPQDLPPVATQTDPNSPPPVVQQQDPYAGQAPMTTAPTVKRRNLWWVWMLVGIGGAVVITAIVLGAYYGTRSDPYYYYSAQVPSINAPANAPARGNDLRSVLADVTVAASARGAEVAPLLNVRF